jgi:hypothetical protein
MRVLCLEQGALRPAAVISVIATDRIERVISLVLEDSAVFVAGGFLAHSKPPALEQASNRVVAAQPE